MGMPGMCGAMGATWEGEDIGEISARESGDPGKH
jgi:hypothetical protein